MRRSMGMLLVWLLLSAMAMETSANKRAIRAAAELSMVVAGEVLIDPDGSVPGVVLDEADALPLPVRTLVERLARSWRFEPVQIDGAAVEAKARMRLLVVASPDGEGGYRIRLESGRFGEDARHAVGHAGAGPAVESLRALDMSPPRYPRPALEEGVQGTVYLVLRVGRHGAVDALAVEQVNLRTYGNPAQLERMRAMLAGPALRAARDWTFEVPAADPGDGRDDRVVRIPVEYSLDGGPPGPGQWKAYLPGPRHALPWHDAAIVADGDPETLVAGVAHLPGRGYRLLTPIHPEG